MTDKPKPEAERLADDFAHAMAKWNLESLYGTSKSYTEECRKDVDVCRDRLADELRRLSAALADAQAQVAHLTQVAARVSSEAAVLQVEAHKSAKQVARLQAQNATAWNRGHAVGTIAVGKLTQQVAEHNQRDAWGNSQLTEALMAAEAARDEAQAQVARLEADAQVRARRLAWLMDYLTKHSLLRAEFCRPPSPEAATGDWWVLRSPAVIAGGTCEGFGKDEWAAIDKAMGKEQAS
jgi:chromosome segregation ATPase